MRVLSGDPLVAIILGVEGLAQMKPADRERIMADLGLSDPLAIQYVRWLGDIGAGRLGKSFFRVKKYLGENPRYNAPGRAVLQYSSYETEWR